MRPDLTGCPGTVPPTGTLYSAATIRGMVAVDERRNSVPLSEG